MSISYGLSSINSNRETRSTREPTRNTEKEFTMLRVQIPALVATLAATCLPIVAQNADDLDTLVSRSLLICRATVESVDMRDWDPLMNEPLTTVHLRIDEILKGSWPGSSFELHLRGGELPDGTFMGYSIVPTLVPGETYFLAVKGGKHHVTPFASAHFGALREARLGDAIHYLDDSGREVIADSTGHLKTLDKTGPSNRALFAMKLGMAVKDDASSADRSRIAGLSGRTLDFVSAVKVRIARAQLEKRDSNTPEAPFSAYPEPIVIEPDSDRASPVPNTPSSANPVTFPSQPGSEKEY